MNTSCRYISAISLTVVALGITIGGCVDMGDTIPTKAPPSSPELSVSDVTVNEGDTAVFVISSGIADTVSVIFTYATAAGTADENLDFIPVTGFDTIHPGSTNLAIRVVVTEDAIVEPAENFTLTISTPVNATIVKGTGTCTIAASDFVGVSFTTDIKPLLDSRCLSCHGLQSPQSNFRVISYSDVLTSGLRAPNVIPGNGQGSRLYYGTTSSSVDIDQMPKDGPYLSTQQQQSIKDWIDQGAQNN
ncbi:MAG: Calx-beta domain-containing protein [Candidatus Zixiibacteriota bacterium]